MYRVVLVDDEEIVLKGIQKVYHLEDYGFCVAGAFTDALEALEKLPALDPALVITDMKMPKLSGLAFIDQARKIVPDAEFVVLSGHDDFVFAQESLKLGVADYLLKPVRKEAFGQMLTKLKEKIDARRADRDYYGRVERWLSDNAEDLTTRFFVNLSENNQYDRSLYHILETRHGESILDVPFVLVRVSILKLAGADDYLSAIERLGESMAALLSSYGSLIRFQLDDVISFFVYAGKETPAADQTRAISGWKDRHTMVAGMKQMDMDMGGLIEARRAAGDEMTVGISRLHQGIGELFQARNECVRHIFMQEASLDIGRDEHEIGQVEVDVKLPYLEIEHLFQEISTGKREKIDQIIARAYEPARQYMTAEVKDFASLITFLIILRVYQTQTKVDPSLNLVSHAQLDIQRIEHDYPNLESQMHLARTVSEKLAEAVARQGVGSGKKIIQSALEYIEKHFCENISLADVADAIGISKNYLANLFKKELDITLINYVTNLRIEEAKRLVRQGKLKMYEVASAVGYNDYAYFSQVFKRHTGVTLSAWQSSGV